MAGKKTRINALDEFLDHADETAQAIRSLAGRDGRSRKRSRARTAPKTRGRSPGRPPRRETGVAQHASAPFPELATTPAAGLYKVIRAIDDVALLRRSHRFEAAHLRRQTVTSWIEDRLRQLGSPLGGPKTPPLKNYTRLSRQDVLAWLETADPEAAASAYAWEFYHARRPHVLHAARGRCGSAGDELVEATAPYRGRDQLEEPFPGFDALSTSPHARPKLRAALGAQSNETLLRTREYESLTRERTTMLAALGVLLRARGVDKGA